jgi:vacuolar-type H+-ATPase subunit E/Vma4
MTMSDELAPVRRALLDQARAEAERTLAEARAAAAQQVARAQRDADEILATARNSGTSDATAMVAGNRRQVRGDARDIDLAAQHAVYEDLLTRVTASVEARLATPTARAALRHLVIEALGDDAVITDRPDGSIVGVVAGRRMEISPRRLAADGLARCAARVRELWTS